MNEKEILAGMKRKFEQLYGGEGNIYFAPGRVNLIGEHTDYNGGHVFPCALTIGTYAIAKRRDDDLIRMASMNINDAKITQMHTMDYDREGKDSWTGYVRGVIWALRERGLVIEKGFDVLYYGNIPAGSGLSSSASLEVLSALCLKDLYGFEEVSQLDLAYLGQKAESDFVGMKCGIMDQFASAMGRKNAAMFLQTDSMEFEYLPLALDKASIVITNSMVKHSLASSEYNTRRAECETAVKELKKEYGIDTLGELQVGEFEKAASLISDPVIKRRAKHAVYENDRTIRAVCALKQNDISTFGKLMNESHASLRDDYEVSCPEIDDLVACAQQTDGVYGSRITGGGFGGCTVSIIDDAAVQVYMDAARRQYMKKYSKEPEFYVVAPGQGARKIG